jgi:hypothetical protein
MRLFAGISGHNRPYPRQRGQSMTEYLIILPSLLLLVLGVIQFALIYQAKASLNYATFMGARQGALKNANMTSIMDGVAGGMTPFFMRTSNAPFLDDMAKARMISAIEVFNPNTAKVEIISPTPEAFDAFSLMSTTGDISNDNLMFRDSSVLKDGMSIQDANLLKIRVTYCVKLMVPFVDRVIYALNTGIAEVKNMTQASYWASNAETIPNLCSKMNDTYATARQQVDSLTASMPAGVSLTANGLANAVINQLPQQFPTIPVLNWNVGGMRIPITAEAIVRMQSPVKF